MSYLMLDSSGAAATIPVIVNNCFVSPSCISKFLPIGSVLPKYFFAIFGVTIAELLVEKGLLPSPWISLKSKILNSEESTMVKLSLNELLLTFISVFVVYIRHIASTSGKLLCMAGPIGMGVTVFLNSCPWNFSVCQIL